MTPIFTALWLAAALPAAAAAAPPPPTAPTTTPRDSLYKIDATWTDQDGREMKLASLAGKPVVLAMIYTRCRAMCPVTIGDMTAIERTLSEEARRQVRFVLVSFDPEHDSPQTLKELAASRALDPARWTLLTGKEDDVRDLIAVLGVRLRAVGAEFVHSSVISVLDARGVIRAQTQGGRQDPAPNAKLLETLVDEKLPPTL